MRRLPALAPPEIDATAEPAIAVLLPVLDAALDSLVAAILAAHPELYDDSRPLWLPPIDRHARLAGRLLGHVHRLRNALRRYRRAAPPAPAPHLSGGSSDRDF